MKDNSNFSALMHAVCVGLGYCGSVKDGRTLHVTDLLPAAGMLSAEDFASCVFLAEGMAPDTKNHREEIMQAFVQHMGADRVDVMHLDWSKPE
ncbi:hypothetical protein [Hyphomonas johnsonii]|uniref:Uncharacterized protein n=1 Tax=Hyphomonas johnsonii MHS-2 TaxID=1280950 RepID=A0A059FUU9_9PROT|nr:hypothetical protein [Hyphomonas johnsonii]KCZ94460.1 hypothetical protein HJO_03760 [Hyphomonas johnsonii MHS-2]